MKSPRARPPPCSRFESIAADRERPTGNYLCVLIIKLPAFEARRELGSPFAMSRQELSIRIIAGLLASD
jgi:hypothetical protein